MPPGSRLYGSLLLLLLACTGRDPQFRQYYVQGERLYLTHCANCHQKDGSGLGLLYPPLAGSDYLVREPQRVICLMKYGISEPLVVNGDTYTQPMPGNLALTPLELAELATYIHNSWGNSQGITTVAEVQAALATCPQ